MFIKKKAPVLFNFRCWPARVQSFEPTTIHNSKIRFQYDVWTLTKPTSHLSVLAMAVYVQYDNMRCYLQANETWGSDLYLDVVMKTVHRQSSSHFSWGLGLCRRYSAVVTARVGGAGLKRGLRAGGVDSCLNISKSYYILSWSWRFFQLNLPTPALTSIMSRMPDLCSSVLFSTWGRLEIFNMPTERSADSLQGSEH